MNRLAVQDFLVKACGLPVLDVRSPGEYQSGHIPGALSFPLFTNEERALIGSIYKREGRKPAIKKGLGITGPKMLGFIEKAEIIDSSTLALYCWRGGMRSESMAWLLERYGIQTFVLDGGYKAYRRQLLDFFKKPLPLRVITGYTGSKKTILLHMLRERGDQIVDLEGLAQHQGSSFGNQKSCGQPPTEHFQNLLYDTFRKLDISRPIWIEDENIRIGQVDLADGLYRQMNESPHIFLDIKTSQRVDYLVDDYGTLTKEQLTGATRAISKKLGMDKTSRAIQYIEGGDLKKAAEIILTYYDAQYDKSLCRKKHLIQEHYKIDISELPDLALRLAATKQIVNEL